MVPEIDRLRARRWVNGMNAERRSLELDDFVFDLVEGPSTIELVERHADIVESLVRFRYTKTQAAWRVQHHVGAGRFRAVQFIEPTRYLAELLVEVNELRDHFVQSLLVPNQV